MPYLQSKAPEILSNKNITLEKLYQAYLDLTDYTALQRRELDYLLTHLNGDNVQNVLDILDRKGLNPAFIKWFKNMAWNSSFELFDSTTLIPTYWSAGVSDNNSNFYGTYSMKLVAGETSQQIDSARTNPQWYVTFVDSRGYSSLYTRVSFHKKGGAVAVEVLDENENPFLLTRIIGLKDTGETMTETGTSLIYASNSNWESDSYSVSFAHGANTAIRVKFANTDPADAAYIDALIIEPDYTGRWPSSYSDGPFSAGSILVSGGNDPDFVYTTNAAQVDVVSASEVVAVTKDITFTQRSKVAIYFSCKCTIGTGASNLTAKTYIDGVAQGFAPAMYCDSANTFTHSYTTYQTGIDAGSKTILVKLQTDANTGTIAIGDAKLVILIYPDAFPSMPNPTEFTATAVSHQEIDTAWTNPTADGFSEVELYRYLSALTNKTRTWCAANTTSDYTGTGTSDTSTGLDLGTQYFYKIFAKYVISGGTYYSSGVTASAITDTEIMATKGYSMCGRDATNYGITDCDEYAPDTWTNKTDAPEPGRGTLASCTISSKCYIYGGEEQGTFYQDCDEYSPDTWANKTDIPLPTRCGVYASTILNKGYIYGGYTSIDSTPTYLTDCDEYSPDTWANKTDMPSPTRGYASASTISNKGYVYGGLNASAVFQDCDEYSSNVWTNKTDMPSPARRSSAASTISNKGYVYGGGETPVNYWLQDCDEYTPDTWTNKTDMPAPARNQTGACTISGKGYVWAGVNNLTAIITDCDEYTPDTWASKTDIPIPPRYVATASGI